MAHLIHRCLLLDHFVLCCRLKLVVVDLSRDELPLNTISQNSLFTNEMK